MSKAAIGHVLPTLLTARTTWTPIVPMFTRPAAIAVTTVTVGWANIGASEVQVVCIITRASIT